MHEILINNYIRIIGSTFVVYLFIVIAIRIFGKKELAQLSGLTIRWSPTSEFCLVTVISCINGDCPFSQRFCPFNKKRQFEGCSCNNLLQLRVSNLDLASKTVKRNAKKMNDLPNFRWTNLHIVHSPPESPPHNFHFIAFKYQLKKQKTTKKAVFSVVFIAFLTV